MKESQLGFSYVWKDLQPIHPTMLLVLGAQLVGAVLGIALELAESRFLSVWAGAAALTAPAYLAGIAWQAARNGADLRLHRQMILRVGGISLVFFLAAILLLLEEPTSRFYRRGDTALDALISSSRQLRASAPAEKAGDCRFSRPHPKARPTYRCRVAETSRDAIRSALVVAGWDSVSPTPPNALFAYRRQEQMALFACSWNAGYCELWLSAQQLQRL